MSTHCSDNLAVLRGMPAESVDLIYLDPPFFTQKRWTGTAGSFDDRWPTLNAYLDFMRLRLVELHRVLRPTGSLYLHCDVKPSANLAVMLDEIFGPDHVLGHIVWKRTHGSHSATTRGMAHVWDPIHAYHKGDEWTFHKPPGDAGTTLWLDCPGPPPKRERLGWPTQKPEALLVKIIETSSNPGDLVLDPFCGCGTTLAVAKKLDRRWVGIDANPDAIALTRKRLDAIPESLLTRNAS